MTRNYDYVVVGAGTMGRSSAFYLSLKYPNAKVALVEQYKFNHEEGSSHSRIRIIRSAYLHPFYRDLTLHAIQSNWKELQEMFKTDFIVQNPFLAFIQDDDQYQNYLKVAQTSSNIKSLSIEEVRKQFPSAPKIQMGNRPVFYDTKAGIILASKYMACILDYLRQAKNVDIYEETQVLSIKNNAKGVSLQLRQKNEDFGIFAKKVSLCCGRWIGKLVPQVNQLLKQVRQTISFWKMKKPQQYVVGKAPTFLHRQNGGDLYALPDAGGDGLKYAVHQQNPNRYKHLESEEQFIGHKMQEIKQRMELHYKGDQDSVNKVENCYYTVTKTEDFLIDWTDQHENVLVCSPCSGHGFKFSPIIGQIVADLLEKDQSIELFEKFRYLTRLFYHQGINLS